MGSKLKLALAAGATGAIALGSFAAAQTVPPSPAAAHAKAARHACGAPGRARRAILASRLVHSDAKVQVKDGFAFEIADRGRIESVDGSTVTVRRADGVAVRVHASAQTVVCLDGRPAGLGQLTGGDTALIARSRKADVEKVRAIRAASPGSSSSPSGPPSGSPSGSRAGGQA